MQIEVKGRNLPVTDELREHVDAALREDRQAGQSDLAVLEVEVCEERNPANPENRSPRRRCTSRASRCARKDASRDLKHSINLVADELAARSSATATSAASGASSAPRPRPRRSRRRTPGEARRRPC